MWTGTSLTTYLQTSLGRCCQLLGPVLAEHTSLSQFLLQLLLPSFQCWIGAARKEPVILNQFCATGEGECWLDWGVYSWMGGGDGMNRTEWWWSEKGQDDRGEDVYACMMKREVRHFTKQRHTSHHIKQFNTKARATTEKYGDESQGLRNRKILKLWICLHFIFAFL